MRHPVAEDALTPDRIGGLLRSGEQPITNCLIIVYTLVIPAEAGIQDYLNWTPASVT
jgi:hypothetical protein